jgi:hypothetical protein
VPISLGQYRTIQNTVRRIYNDPDTPKALGHK